MANSLFLRVCAIIGIGLAWVLAWWLGSMIYIAIRYLR